MENETLAERFGQALGESGLTQDKLGDIVGTSQAAIQKIANGKTRRPRQLLAIARALKVNAEWLETGKGEKYKVVASYSQQSMGGVGVEAESATYTIPIGDAERALLDAFRRLTERQRVELLESALAAAKTNDEILGELGRSQKSGVVKQS